MYILTLNPGMYSDYYGNLRPVIGVDSAHTLGELIAKLAYSVVQINLASVTEKFKNIK